MSHTNRHNHGFSLTEVLIASSLLFSFATLSVGSYRNHIGHEQITANSASARAWLEDVSRIAQQFNTSCLLEVDLGNGSLEPKDNNPSTCSISTPHALGGNICVVKDPEAKEREQRCKNMNDDLSIELTPRATAVVGQEIEFSTGGIDTVRCLLVSEPLGLIRSGIGNGSNRCDYSLES